jgi:hypothetical protein
MARATREMELKLQGRRVPREQPMIVPHMQAVTGCEK